MENKIEVKTILINDNCEARIKPKLIRDVKTEALLVFARTALERFFKKLEDEQVELFLNNKEDTQFVYDNLKELLFCLQKHIVNVDYLLNLMKLAKENPTSMELKKLAKYEEPLIVYYDAMAKKMEYHFPSKTTVLPEFIIVCCLSIWLLEEEKSIVLFPFLEKFALLELIDRFEKYANSASSEKKKSIIHIHRVSLDIIETLKKTKYRFNRQRNSKRKR